MRIAGAGRSVRAVEGCRISGASALPVEVGFGMCHGV